MRLVKIPKRASNISVKTGTEVEDSVREVEDYERVVEEADKEEIVSLHRLAASAGVNQ